MPGRLRVGSLLLATAHHGHHLGAPPSSGADPTSASPATTAASSTTAGISTTLADETAPSRQLVETLQAYGLDAPEGGTIAAA